jgi:ribosomal protein S18 acetylase RimI-like enzyme
MVSIEVRMGLPSDSKSSGELVVFRPLAPEDAEAYRAIRRSALVEAPQFVGPLAEREAGLELVELRSQLRAYPAQGIHVFGTFIAGDAAAVAAMTRKLDPKYAHKLFLWGMFVLPEFRGKSIGRRFLDHLLAFGRQQAGVRFINLQVTTTNTPARALYASRGFVSYGVEREALRLDAGSFDFEMMQLDLQQAGNGADV